MKKFKLFGILLTLGLLVTASAAEASRQLDVVTTTTDLAAIAEAVGGSRIQVTPLIQGNQDPHFIEPRTSMVARLRRADLFIIVGMELDVWAFSLIDAARNSRIVPGGIGYLNASTRVDKLEVPEEGVRIDASQGHVHPAGNPHYLLDPVNGKIVAGHIADHLGRLAPEDQAYFQANLARFSAEIDRLVAEVAARLQPYQPIKAVTYHKSWEYFAQRFNIRVAGYLEPLPGIAPSQRHLRDTVEMINREAVPLIIQEPWYSRQPGNFAVSRTKARLAVLPTMPGGVPEATDYPATFRVIADRLIEALEGE